MKKKPAPAIRMPARSKGQPTSLVLPVDIMEWLTADSIRLGIPRTQRIIMCIKREMDYDKGKGPK